MELASVGICIPIVHIVGGMLCLLLMGSQHESILLPLDACVVKFWTGCNQEFIIENIINSCSILFINSILNFYKICIINSCCNAIRKNKHSTDGNVVVFSFYTVNISSGNISLSL